jgi:hypothetical protein
MPGLKDKSMSSSAIDHLIINSPCQEPAGDCTHDRRLRAHSGS